MLTNPMDNKFGKRRMNNSDMEAGFDVHFEIPFILCIVNDFLGWGCKGKVSLPFQRGSKKGETGQER